ncbi:MAG: caspase family protein [Methylocella sp.]
MKRAAVIIGVNKTGVLTPLKSAALGAKRVAEWLDKEKFEIKLLTDDEGPVTSLAVEEATKGLVTLPASNQLLVVYFSGHGLWHLGSDVWLLSGAPESVNQAINLNASMDLAKCSGIPNVVFVSDACRSIPDSRKGVFVKGIPVFPNYNITKASKIDFFKATSEARSAYEGTIAGDTQSLLTAALMAAYKEPEPDMIRKVTEGDETIDVVPNRKLENFLQRKVNAFLEDIDINLSQEIDVNVPSSDEVYIARVLGSPREFSTTATAAASRPPSSISAVGRAAAEAVSASLSMRGFERGGFDELQSDLGEAVEGRLQRRMPELGPDRFESRTGFVVHGATVRRAAVARAESELIVEVFGPEPGQAHTVVRLRDPHQFVVPDGAAASVGVQFADGRCVVLASLPGFIGHVVMDERGMSNVSYVPSANDRRWRQYDDRRKEVDRLRAMVALAVEGERFHVKSEREGLELAGRIRMWKGVDPTLGLYAAQAFSQAGDENKVLSVLNYMRDELRADLFDVRLLASRQLEGSSRRFPVTPFCPMLTQTWSLLSTRGVDVPAPLQQLTPWLCNSLWTTFGAAAADAVMQLIIEGELR